MSEPLDALERLLLSPLCGGLDEPVQRDGRMLLGITRPLYLRYGGGHLTKTEGRSTAALGARVHREVREAILGASKSRVCTMHPYSRQAVALLREHHLRAVAAEVPIARGRIGTRVDIIAKTPFGGYALVSLKTGARRGPDRARRRPLPAPFEGVKRCERALDDLQLTAELGIARAGHGVDFDDAYVLEVPEGVLRRVPEWVRNREMQDALVADLSKCA